MTEVLTVDDLAFDVRRSARRKTLEITLDRGGELVISAPPGIDDEVLAAFVREKRFWLYTKMAEKEARQQPVGAKEFVPGEGFLYLGRSHRLKLVGVQAVPLKLSGGQFHLLRGEVDQGREHFVRWYVLHAKPWLERRVAQWAARMGVTAAGVDVLDLGYRWGSCGQGGTLNFHWATILLPARVIDYVVVHELAHLAEPNHTPAFWAGVARALPEYEQRKAWLAERGGEHVAL